MFVCQHFVKKYLNIFSGQGIEPRSPRGYLNKINNTKHEGGGGSAGLTASYING